METINKTQLKKRGWTDSILKKLGVTYSLTKTGHYGNIQQLFDLQTIVNVEQTNQFAELLQKSKKRSDAAKKRYENEILEELARRDKAIVFAQTVEIVGKKILDADKLLTLTIHHYNQNALNCDYSKRCPGFASKNSDQNFLKRIQINYVRHRRTNYENLLNTDQSDDGGVDFYDIIKARVNYFVVTCYPHLAGGFYV